MSFCRNCLNAHYSLFQPEASLRPSGVNWCGTFRFCWRKLMRGPLTRRTAILHRVPTSPTRTHRASHPRTDPSSLQGQRWWSHLSRVECSVQSRVHLALARLALGTSPFRSICILREITHQLEECRRLPDEQSHCGKKLQNARRSATGIRWPHDRTCRKFSA